MIHPGTTRTILICLLILTLVALAESLYGRPLWCACAELRPWSWVVKSSHNSQHVIDPYTFSHVLHGLVFYALLHLSGTKFSISARFLIAILIEGGWELLENSDFLINRYRTATFSLDYYGDSIANSLSDIVACGLGFIIAARIPARATVALFLLIELLMVATIRDNLTLNVIMLLYPIDAIRAWQG